MSLPYQIVRASQQPEEKIGSASTHYSSHYVTLVMGYTDGLLNLYAGPLFANLIAYDLLDCAIWGISPTLFFIIQSKLREILTTGDNCYRKRFVLLTLCAFLFLPIGYAALNYSEKFKWNYFTRLVNLDVGYIILDLSIKVVIFVFAVQMDQQQDSTEQTKAVEVVNSHKFTFIGEFGCYVLAFCFCMFGKKGQEFYNYSLSVSSFIGCILIIPTPVIYYFQRINFIRMRYQECPESKILDEEEVEYQFKKSAKVELLAFFLLKSSLYINLAYSTYWMMFYYLNNKVLENRAFMQSVKWGSFYFIISSMVSFLFGYILKYFTRHLTTITSIFHLLFGIFLIFCWKQFSVEEFGVCIIISGLQMALLNHYQAITKLQHLLDRVILISEIVSFCVIPIIITLTTQIDEAVIFVLLSGVACIISSALLMAV